MSTDASRGEGPPFFAYSVDEALVGLLSGAGLRDLGVQRPSFTHRPRSSVAW